MSVNYEEKSFMEQIPDLIDMWRHVLFIKVSSRSKGCGGGQVVSVLAFYSDDPSSNPAEVYNSLFGKV